MVKSLARDRVGVGEDDGIGDELVGTLAKRRERATR